MRDHSRDYYDDKYIDGRYPSVKAPAQDYSEDDYWDDDEISWEDKGAITVRGGMEDEEPASWRAAARRREVVERRAQRADARVRGGAPVGDTFLDEEPGEVDESDWELNRYLQTLPQRTTTRRRVGSGEQTAIMEDGARSWRREPAARRREREDQARQEDIAAEGATMPLAIALVVTTVLLTILAGVGRLHGYRDLDLDLWRRPFLTLVFDGLHEGISPIAALTQDVGTEGISGDIENAVDANRAAAGDAQGTMDDGSDVASTAADPEPESVDLEIPDGVNDEVVQAVDYGVCESRFLAPSGTTFEPLTSGIYAPNGTWLEPQTVDERYLADALLIGDSRTDGLHLYGDLKDDAYFWCKEALSIYDIYDTTASFYAPGVSDGTEETLEEALGEATFRKIYISIGINELGTPDTVRFYNCYKELLAYLRERQPDAMIYIQGIMHVSASYSQSDSAFNNTNIVEKNTAIATLANGRDLFYLDMNDQVCDENGDLLPGLSNDGLHLKASAYALWREDLLTHAFVRDDADWTPAGETRNAGVDGEEPGVSGQGTGKPESDISAVTGLVVQ